ncbi:tyrosinase family oxidase copper chaperone [Streptomyces sp. MS06]|uniref:tyrosinase family oxidase copper chaperone n=1 Tax=Streptomyces sp. MS06 TaxID=3385974 RepID=UPI00399FD4F0
MAVSGVGEVLVGGGGAESPAGAPPRPAPVPGTRREALRGLLAPALALALVPLATSSRPSRPSRAARGVGGAAFDENYRGRRIQGAPIPGSGLPGARGIGPDRWRVAVDGRPLHLMRRADGSWMSMLDHYDSFTTPLAATRAAVDVLAPGEHLRAHGSQHGTRHASRHGTHLPAVHGGTRPTGGDHGVHA